jgi:hypothetical protein
VEVPPATFHSTPLLLDIIQPSQAIQGHLSDLPYVVATIASCPSSSPSSPLEYPPRLQGTPLRLAFRQAHLDFPVQRNCPFTWSPMVLGSFVFYGTYYTIWHNCHFLVCFSLLFPVLLTDRFRLDSWVASIDQDGIYKQSLSQPNPSIVSWSHKAPSSSYSQSPVPGAWSCSWLAP